MDFVEYVTTIKQIELSSSKVAICDTITAAEYYELTYGIASYTLKDTKSAKFWNKMVQYTVESGKLTIVVATKKLTADVRLLLLLAQFYSLPVLYAGPSSLLSQRERDTLNIEPEDHSNTLVVTEDQQLDNLPDVDHIILNRGIYFRHWYKLAKWQIGAEVEVSDYVQLDVEEIDLDTERKILLHAIHILKKISRSELQRLILYTAEQKWGNLDKILQQVFYLGVQDQFGYEALRRYFAHEQITSVDKVAHNMYTITYQDKGKLKHCSITLQKLHAQCSCSQYEEAVPCKGQILFFTQLHKFGLQWSNQELVQYLKGYGAVAGLLHQGLILESSRTRFTSQEIHYELTREGHLIAQWNITDTVFFTIKGIVHKLAENKDITLFTILYATAHIYSKGFSVHQILIGKWIDSWTNRGIQIYLQIIQLLTHQYGLYRAFDELEELRAAHQQLHFSFI